MKKVTLLIIGIVYFLSIVVVSLMGMRAVVFEPIVPVQRIEIIQNTSQDWSYITDTLTNSKGEAILDDDDNPIEVVKRVEIKFTTPGEIGAGGIVGTFIQIEPRIFPDNATNKRVLYAYDKKRTDVEFVKDDDGNERGLILFKSKAWLTLTVRSVDGSGKSITFVVWAN